MKCLLLRLAFFSLCFSSFVCFMVVALNGVYGAEKVYGGFFSLFGAIPGKASVAVFTAVLIGAGVFLSVCAASLAFTLKTEFFYVTDKNQSRPKSFVSFGSGVRYIRYKTLVFFKKTVAFFRFTLPFFLQLFAVAVLLNIYGLNKEALTFCAVMLVFTLVFSLFCFFVRCRLYDTGLYLMYLNRRLSPADAVFSSEEKTAGKLLPLAVYKFLLLPKKVASLFLFSSLFTVPFTGVFNALVCEKLYGENKKKVKVPAVTFYIGKKTKMEMGVPEN